MKTWSAAVRLRPRPPAPSEISSTGGPDSDWKRSTTAPRSRVEPSSRVKAIAGALQHGLDAVEQRGPLREDERLVAVGDGFFEELEQQIELRGARRGRAARDEAGVAGGLAQAQQRLERGDHAAAAAEARHDVLAGRGAHGVVERALFVREHGVEHDLACAAAARARPRA